MAKIHKSFRIENDLNFLIKSKAEEEGITASQLIELACYKYLSNSINKPKKIIRIDTVKKTKKIPVTLYTSDNTYYELMKRVAEKNSTVSQELDYILRASLTNSAFNSIEFRELYAAKKDINKLGNLLKLSLNNNLNTPELLNKISEDILKIQMIFDNYVALSSHRKIKK